MGGGTVISPKSVIEGKQLALFRQAARYMAENKKVPEVARLVGRAESTIYAWQHHPKFMEIFRSEMDGYIKSLKPLCIDVLRKQTTSKNEWVQQNAANSIIKILRDSETALGLSIEVTWTGGMVEPQLPDADSGAVEGKIVEPAEPDVD